MAKRRRNFLKKRFSKFMQKRLVLLYAGIVLVFVVLLGRVAVINGKSGDTYTKYVLDSQANDSTTIPYKRGDILDANGTKLATSERVYNVIVDVQLMLSDDGAYTSATENVLKNIFGVTDEEIAEMTTDFPNSQYYPIKKGVDYTVEEQFEEFEEKQDEYQNMSTDNMTEAQIAEAEQYTNVKGIWLEEDYQRQYPYNTLACDVIGFGSNSAGSTGIEAYYNTELTGTDGKEYGYLDTDSTYSKTVKEPTDGNSVVTTIDLEVQTIVEQYILQFNNTYTDNYKEGLGAKNIAVMVMDPQNGEILAEASYPNYDLNNPDDLSEDALATYTNTSGQTLTNDELEQERQNYVWSNFCVSQTFEPGSTFKPFTVSAALDTGIISGDEKYSCGGVLHVGDDDVHCHNRSGHGTITVKGAIEQSCNVALMHIGLSLGADEFCRYQSIFGFGEYTDIDLPGEGDTSSLLYQPDDMGEADLATNSFGQNFECTMTQLCAGFCSLINGGNYYVPHVVKQIEDSNGNVVESKSAVLARKTISEDTSVLIRDYMRGVVEEGTGKAAAVEGYDVGGKTGTAEKLPRDDENYVISFIGYAPQDNPQVVVYVVIDEPNVADQSTGSYASTLAKNIMTDIFPYLGVTRNDDEVTTETTNIFTKILNGDDEDEDAPGLVKKQDDTTDTTTDTTDTTADTTDTTTDTTTDAAGTTDAAQ